MKGGGEEKGKVRVRKKRWAEGRGTFRCPWLLLSTIDDGLGSVKLIYCCESITYPARRGEEVVVMLGLRPRAHAPTAALLRPSA